MKEYNATLIDYGEGKGDLVVHVGEGHPDVKFIVKAFTNMFVDLERPAEHLDHLICPYCLKEFYTSERVWKEGDEK